MAVSFCRTKTLSESINSEDKDCVFFPTDNDSIVMGGKTFGGGGGFKIKCVSLAEYNAMETHETNTVYLIKAESQSIKD